jgi:hypothetical protein
MNSLIARVSVLVLVGVSLRFSAEAQSNTSKKDTNKVIVVVAPQTGSRPVKRNIAPTTSERAGAYNYGDTVTGTPVRTTSSYNTAPSTSERSGYPSYMDQNYQPPQRSQSNVAVGVNGIATPPVTSPTPVPVSSSGHARTTIAHKQKKPAVTSSQPASPYAAPSDNSLPGTDATPIPVTPDNTTHNVTGTSGLTPANTPYMPPAGDTSPVNTAPYDAAQKQTVTIKHDTIYIRKTDTVKIKDDTKQPRHNQILFGEVGGAGLSLSLNYDMRITSARNGLGFRIGAGYYGNGGNTVFSIPFQVNYLVGTDTHFIEIGGGTTFINSTGDNKGKTFIFDRVTGLAGTATLGYRYQPIDHKLNFRLDFVPIFYYEGVILAGGISVGYNF